MHPIITLLDVEALKKSAKRAKATLPELSHAQRLNHLAGEMFKARHFHELKQWLDRSLAMHYVAKDNGVVHCNFCRYSFVPDMPEDTKLHVRRHQNYEEALAVLGCLPMPHDQREAAKKKAHLDRSTAQTPEQELDAVERILRAWFDRSLESAIGAEYWKVHPRLEEFASMMYLTVKDYLRMSDGLYLAKYGHKPGHIATGNAYWVPQDR